MVRVSTLHLVDLAGSERLSKSGAAGTHVKEASLINASLLTLGVVINKLISGDSHVPYRDSKLTRLLSTSLGGNAKTAVIVTIAPSAWNLGETRSSLSFAARAMKVRSCGASDIPACTLPCPSTPAAVFAVPSCCRWSTRHASTRLLIRQPCCRCISARLQS